MLPQEQLHLEYPNFKNILMKGFYHIQNGMSIKKGTPLVLGKKIAFQVLAK